MVSSCTIFKNLFDKAAYVITIDKALERIRNGASKNRIEEIREQISEDRAKKMKENLPSVCFSGVFQEREDAKIKQHSGMIVLDFDNVSELRDKQEEIINHEFVYACWISPRGNGIKALVKIADGKKHREHFQALQEIFPEVDRSGINESRVCFESYDPGIFVNKEAKPFAKLKAVVKVESKKIIDDIRQVFQNILKWLANRGDAFVTGERNLFIFKLASACCRFGIDLDDCVNLISNDVLQVSDSFTQRECEKAIGSAYKRNASKAGTVRFEKDILVDKVTRTEIEIDESFFDETIKPKDVIFGEDVKEEALRIYDLGYERVDGIGVKIWDDHFKFKRGEITLLSGIGNYGKSMCWHWFLLMRILKHEDRFAFFSPESNPPSEFYHDFVETLLGCDCTPFNPGRPNREIYQAAYDWISKRVFYVYPKDLAPTPQYIKERFLELIIKERVSGVLIDPFNQLQNDYGLRSDKYLETFLGDCSRFAQLNNIFFSIIAHPKSMKKNADGNYPAPDLFDIADGAMWNNKMDNIVIYHRPNHQKDPQSSLCELITRKIKRQKIVGKKGFFEFEYFRPKRRYFFEGADPMQKLIDQKKLDFMPKQQEMFPKSWKPMKDFEEI